MNIQEKIELCVNLILIGEILIAEAIVRELKTGNEIKELSRNLENLFSAVDNYLEIHKGDEDELFNLKNKYREYLLNKI